LVRGYPARLFRLQPFLGNAVEKAVIRWAGFPKEIIKGAWHMYSHVPDGKKKTLHR